MRTEVFAQLQAADWPTLIIRVGDFAARRALRYRWENSSVHELAHGVTIKDIVQRVIIKTLNGQRQWDPDKGALEPWLKDQVKSEIDALYKSAAHRHEARFEESEEDDEEAPGAGGTLDRPAHSVTATDIPTPEEEVVRNEDLQEASEKVGLLYEAADQDPLGQKVVTAIMAGHGPKCSVLAGYLGISVEEVYNCMKRLRRTAAKLAERIPSR